MSPLASPYGGSGRRPIGENIKAKHYHRGEPCALRRKRMRMNENVRRIRSLSEFTSQFLLFNGCRKGVILPYSDFTAFGSKI